MSSWVYLPIVVGTFLMSALLVRVSIAMSHKWDLLDQPDGGRKIQVQPVPRLGGVAVALTFSIALVGVALAGGQVGAVGALTGVLVPGLMMAALGYLDDVRPIAPWLRLLTQIGIACLTWALGTRIYLTPWEPLNGIILILWIVAIVNAINMLDNSDGLAASVSAIIAASTAGIAVYLGQYLVAALACSLVGVAAGFLWHNWHPAKVYLGDAGAYFLGFMLAVLAVRLRPVTVTSGWSAVVPLLLMAVPLGDLLFVVVRRVSNGVHPFTAGRDHVSHALQAWGRSVPQSVVILVSITALTCLAALLLVSVLA